MDIVASGDSCITPLLVEVCTNPEGAIWTRPTAGADTVAVTVEDGGRKIAFNGPFPKRFLELDQSGKTLTLLDGGHGDRNGTVGTLEG